LHDLFSVMSKDSAFPHILLYGAPGSGIKTLIKSILCYLFDDITLTSVNYPVNIASKNTLFPIQQSLNHIVIEPTNNNIDKYIIQDIIKSYAVKVPLSLYTHNTNFKVVLIHNIELLSKSAQASLRRTMELYSSTCRFIVWANNLSRVIEPLRSRFLCLRVAAPNRKELLQFTHDICYKEQIQLSATGYEKIITESGGNIKKLLWSLQMAKYNISNITSYNVNLDKLVDLISKRDPKIMQEIRQAVYSILIAGIDETKIITDIVEKLDPSYELFEFAAKYQHRIVISKRPITHIEGFITSIIAYT
jgi:replication factor C subunit 3/5